jgi:cytochrome P450 family 710 subfamily A protein
MAASSLCGFLDIRAAVPLLLLAAVAFYVLMEQLSYRRKKGPLPGPPLVVPFFGSIAQLIRDPPAYWDGLAARAKASELGLSADYLLGTFVVFIRDTELSHRVLANVRPDAFHFIGHPFGKELFGEHSLIYMSGEGHRELSPGSRPTLRRARSPPTPPSSSASSSPTSGGGWTGAPPRAGRSPSRCGCPAAT